MLHNLMTNIKLSDFTNQHSFFSTVDGYKDKLKNVRDRQREMVHDKTACIVPTKFTYNGSVTEATGL